MASDATPPTFSMNTLVHMLTVKLKPDNFLLWRKQVTALLQNQNLYDIVDPTVDPPAEFIQQTFAQTVTQPLRNGALSPNPLYAQWQVRDRNVNSLLLSSLTEEALSETLSATTARDVWVALHSAYASRSKARELRLCDELQLMRRGSLSVSEYGQKFRTICDQLAAIGALVPNDYKVHWFLRGPCPTYANFSTDQLDHVPLPFFTDILCKVESHAIFQAFLEESVTPPVAFHASNQPRSSGPQSSASGNHGNSGGGSRGGNRGISNGGSRQRRNNGDSGRRGSYTPRCQICREQGHYADK